MPRARKNLFGIGETHHHYTRTSSGGWRSADKKTPKRKSTVDTEARRERLEAAKEARHRKLAAKRAKAEEARERKRRAAEDRRERKRMAAEERRQAAASKRAAVGYRSRLDPESVFESKRERDRFERSMKKWPNPKKKKKNDVIDDLVGTAEGITGTVYQGLSVPYDATVQAGKVALAGKDWVKRKLFGAKNQKNATYETGRWVDGVFHPDRDRKKKRNSQTEADRMYQKFSGNEPTETITVVDEVNNEKHLGILGALLSVRVDTPTGMEAVITFDNPAPYLCAVPKKGEKFARQLYIAAGDQNIDRHLKKLGMDTDEWVKPEMVIGKFSPPRCRTCGADVLNKVGGDFPKKCEVCGTSFEVDSKTGLPNEDRASAGNLEYQARKTFDDNDLVNYDHDLGEPMEGSMDRLEAPTLMYDSVNHELSIAGGNYMIHLPWFGVSPGIEN